MFYLFYVFLIFNILSSLGMELSSVLDLKEKRQQDLQMEVIQDEFDWMAQVRETVLNLAKFYPYKSQSEPYIKLKQANLFTADKKTNRGLILECDENHVPVKIFYRQGCYQFAEVQTCINNAGHLLMQQLMQKILLSEIFEQESGKVVRYRVNKINKESDTFLSDAQFQIPPSKRSE